MSEAVCRAENPTYGLYSTYLSEPRISAQGNLLGSGQRKLERSTITHISVGADTMQAQYLVLVIMHSRRVGLMDQLALERLLNERLIDTELVRSKK